MQIWKFYLLGVTGDLAKKKILPALAQFADLHQEEVQIDLIGYSRSLPNTLEIESILDKHSQTGRHSLRQIHYKQGDYQDPSLLYEAIKELGSQERLVIYLAVPPETYLGFLQTACPYSSQEIDLIIEKPFGQNFSEAQQILQVLQACTLGHRAHFVDHYLFKTATRLTKTDLQNFKNLKDSQIHQINIQALEDMGVKQRGGYYDQTGALKDMFPHLFALMQLVLTTTQHQPSLMEFHPKEILLGQYQGYRDDVDIPNSTTDTYFQIDGELRLSFPDAEMHPRLILESGKKLGIKSTAISMQTNQGEIRWDIAPQGHINYTKDTGETLELNLNKSKRLDHTNMFADILKRDYSYFVKTEDILKIWEMYERIQKLTPKQTRRYRNHNYPLEYID